MKNISRLFLFLILSLWCFGAGCSSDEDCDCADPTPADDDTAADGTDDDDDNGHEETPAPPVLSATEKVVPSDGLPAAVDLQPANNNLDVTRHDGRVFLAFRTAPSHFASDQATLYVVSSADQAQWDLETSIHRGADLREPRLLSWNGKLFLYFAVLGTNPLDFQPQGMMVTEYRGPGDWSEPEFFYEEGFIPWRAKVIDDVPYLLTYVGGENIYDVDPEPMEVHWLTTADGYEWEPVVPGQPVVITGGSSETDFVFLDDGSLMAVSRNEMGDERGFGTNICRAAADDLGDWECVNDPRKYDSPLVFRHGEEVYLIGRRNLNGTGDYDLGYDDLSPALQHLLYELDYWIAPKRTALWRVDPESLSVEFVLDFPSRGDTCFPGLLQDSAAEFWVYNYSSPLWGPDTIWLLGQLSPTYIFRTRMVFPE